jgi:hypothetical protein
VNEQNIQSYLPSLEVQIASKLKPQIDSELKSQISSLESEIISKVQSLIRELKTDNGKDNTEDDSTSRKITDETISSRVENFIKKTDKSREAFNNYAAQSQSSSELSLPEITALPPQKGKEPNSNSDKFGTTTTASDTGGAITDHPFRITSRQNPDNENQYFVTVGLGTINSLIPTGIFNGGGLTEYTLSSNTLRFFVLRGNSDGAQITSASIIFGGSSASAQEPQIFGLPTRVEYLIGAVYNSQVYQVTYNNISISGVQSFATTKSTPAEAGELPIDIYYVWG